MFGLGLLKQADFIHGLFCYFCKSHIFGINEKQVAKLNFIINTFEFVYDRMMRNNRARDKVGIFFKFSCFYQQKLESKSR